MREVSEEGDEGGKVMRCVRRWDGRDEVSEQGEKMSELEDDEVSEEGEMMSQENQGDEVSRAMMKREDE